MMSQGELEKLPAEIERIYKLLERHIMEDVVERIRVNGFPGATANWELTRLQQLGMSQEAIRAYVSEALNLSDEALDAIFSDDMYKAFYGHGPATSLLERIYKDSKDLTFLAEAIKRQTKGALSNITNTMGFATLGRSGRMEYTDLTSFYETTLDKALMEISSGVTDYATALKKAVKQMTNSGLRHIDYATGVSTRIDVAARRAVMTGVRQVQSKLNERVAQELMTDYFEVSYHVGARPSHQLWQGRVWSKDELKSVCGLGEVTGLCGANCYHDYNAFIPGVSVRTYTDEQLEEMIAQENTPKDYNGRSYTTYEALQQQRKMEAAMRKTREDIALLQQGGLDPKDITLLKAKYRGQMGVYKDFSAKMGLPEQKARILQDGLRIGRKNVAEVPFDDIIITGARSPNSKAASEHAEMYYAAIRKRRSDVKKIAINAGYEESEIEAIKNYLFVDTHLLADGRIDRFAPDYMIAESWRRLQENDIKPHDLTLLRHEIRERELVKLGMSQSEAHILATEQYNYAKEAQEFYGKIKKYRKE